MQRETRRSKKLIPYEAPTNHKTQVRKKQIKKQKEKPQKKLPMIQLTTPLNMKTTAKKIIDESDRENYDMNPFTDSAKWQFYEIEEQVADYYEEETIQEAMREQLLYETHYMPNEDYAESQQYIKPKQIIMLFDWMMDVCNGFFYKRETFHRSIILVQRYLSKTSSLPIDYLQLLGLCCIQLASKIQEQDQKPLENLISMCDGKYPQEDFQTMEVVVFKVLGFGVTHNMPFDWMNHYLYLWDQFPQALPNTKFRNQTSHFLQTNYHKIMQYYDAAAIDSYNKIDSKYVALTIIYLYLCRLTDVLTLLEEPDYIIQFSKSPLPLNYSYKQFLNYGIYIDYDTKANFDILVSHIPFIVRYFGLTIEYVRPFVFQQNPGKVITSSLEDILSFQPSNKQLGDFFAHLYEDCQ
ncbi:G1/S-specific cyclin-E1 [Paramecium bursaria]